MQGAALVRSFRDKADELDKTVKFSQVAQELIKLLREYDYYINRSYFVSQDEADEAFDRIKYIKHRVNEIAVW